MVFLIPDDASDGVRTASQGTTRRCLPVLCRDEGNLWSHWSHWSGVLILQPMSTQPGTYQRRGKYSVPYEEEYDPLGIGQDALERQSGTFDVGDPERHHAGLKQLHPIGLHHTDRRCLII